jgi:hypothetical protein
LADSKEAAKMFLPQIMSVYREVHEGPIFEGKDTVNFILTKEIVRLNKILGQTIDELFYCDNCKALLKYHNG